ncbi:asparagine synthase C-terminal domain-containing protein [bacterium]|nr:asparagine synthase C-terminal domain-containing protein [bacterium]NUN46938.1 asparagine synthase [bacterium]
MNNNDSVYFIAFFGDKPPEYFENHVARYAAGIGLTYRLEKQNNAKMMFVKASLGTIQNPADILFSDTHPNGNFRQNSHYLHWETTTEEITVYCAPWIVKQIYYARCGNGWLISDDLRLMIGFASPEIDEVVLYACLQFNSAPAPLTLFRSIRRTRPGCAYRFSFKAVIEDTHYRIPPLENKTYNEAYQDTQKTLSDTIHSIPDRSVLFFSGGVDSALIMAYAGAIQKKIEPVFLSFGSDDPELSVASAISTYLGMPLHVAEFTMEQAETQMARIGLTYSFPFCDYATLPSMVLAEYVAQKFPRHSAIDGTGADGLHGGLTAYTKWQRRYRSPYLVRKMKSWMYRSLSLWRYDTAWSATLAKHKLSAEWPLPVAWYLARNPFNGILYTIPDSVKKEVLRYILDQPMYHEQNLLANYAASDIQMACTGKAGAKLYDSMIRFGNRMIYPYLSPEFVDNGLSLPFSIKCRNGVNKSILKSMLAQNIPNDLVYRKKKGFTPPMHKIFSEPRIRAYIENTVWKKDNPLLSFVDHGQLNVLWRATAPSQTRLPRRAYEFMWNVTALSLWLDQVKKLWK